MPEPHFHGPTYDTLHPERFHPLMQHGAMAGLTSITANPKPKPVARTWGDGVGDQRPHVIGAIDLHSPLPEQYSDCVPCEVRVMVGDQLTLSDAWDLHRGVQPHINVYRMHTLATDAEVHEFLRHVEDDEYRLPIDDFIDVAWKAWADE